MRLFFAPGGAPIRLPWIRPRAKLLHFGLCLPRALALLRFCDLLAGHLCSDVGHRTGDVAARSARRQSKECKLHPLQGFDAILRDTVACGVEKSQVKLREHHALVGRTPKPFGRVDVALLLLLSAVPVFSRATIVPDRVLGPSNLYCEEELVVCRGIFRSLVLFRQV